MKGADKRKGMSKSSSTLLITMLILITASIIWIVLKSPLESTAEQIQFYESDLNIQIEKVQLQENIVNVTVKRNPGKGQFIGTSFIIENGKESEVFIERTTLNELEIKTFSFNLLSINSEEIINIKLSPLFRLDTGEEMIGEVKDEYKLTGY